jgi:cell envelope opacity-associated protein A
MKNNAKPRGATAIDHQAPRNHHKHLLAVAAISACVALAAGLTPSGQVEANREPRQAADDTAQNVERILASTEPAAEAAASPIAENPAAALAALGATEAAEDSTPELAPAPAPDPVPAWIEEEVRSGDNLSLIFKRAGFDNGDVHEVVYESPEGKRLAKIYPGQTVAFLTGAGGELAGVKHIISPL